VDEAALTELLERQLRAGVDGFVLFRSADGSSSSGSNERRRVLELVQERAEGHVFVIAAALDDDAAREMDWLGVDAILSAVPDGISSQRDVVAHATRAARTVDCPVLLSHGWGRSAAHLEPATIVSLAEHGILRGLDVFSGDLDFAAEVLAGTDADFCVMSGDDRATLSMIARGAHGAFSLTATTWKPSGRRTTRSPWLIQTWSVSPGSQTPSKIAEGCLICRVARPNSRWSEPCTSPPSCAHMVCSP